TEKDRSTVYEYVILSEQGTDPVKKACRKEGIDIDNADPKNMAIIQTKVIANQIKNLKKSILKNIGKAKIIGELTLEIERHDCSDIWSPLLIAKFKSNTNIDELKEGYYHVEQDLDGRHNTMIELTSNSIIDYECLGEYYLGDSEELAVKQDEELCREELENHKTDYKWDGIHIEFNDYKTRTVKSDEEIVHDQSAVYEYVVIHHQFPLQIINWSKNSIGDFVSAEPKDKIKVQTEMITYQAEQLKKSILKNIGEAKIIGKIEIEIQRLSYTSKQSPVIIAKFKSNYNIERLADDYFHVYQDILGRHNRMIELTTNSMTTNTDLKSYTDGFIEELSIFKDEYECSIELEEYKTDYEWDGKHIEFIED
ncbi:MAG: hypothetical protein KAH48_07855, partial [Chlorobi bacterium]|nr:hypothetical protein [Chlorobiota bacterium]